MEPLHPFLSFLAQAAQASMEVLGTPAAWWQVLAGQGVLGAVLAWFMFRLEAFLRSIERAKNLQSETLANMTQGNMVFVIALKSLNQSGIADAANKVRTDAEKLIERATHESPSS